MAETPIQHVRVDQDLWDAALKRAGREGRSFPGVVRRLVEAYVEGELVMDVEGRIAVLPPEYRRRLDG